MNRLTPTRVRLLAATAVLLLAGTAHAQQETHLTIGGSLFTLRTSDASATEYSPIVRLSGGVAVSFGLRRGLFVRPGLHYTIRGASLEGVINDQPIEAVSEIAAIEIPLMVGINIPVKGYVQPRVFAGPVFARVVDSSIRFRALSGGDWASESDSSVERNDLGLGLGGEIGFPVGGQSILVGIRGVVGLSNVVKPNPELESTPARYHTGLVFYAGLVL